MILRNITEIGLLRKRFGLTQKELAANSGVSQSLIAKIESGSVLKQRIYLKLWKI
ncbi:helix-turn-helix domain-containing protein [Candidatus Woesearchaeota archaeon]|nr:helix-turn-helix domain-containing protein [Candidatus Woesearchaeota archaeon]